MNTLYPIHSNILINDHIDIMNRLNLEIQVEQNRISILLYTDYTDLVTQNETTLQSILDTLYLTDGVNGI